jgi:carboxypeptidase C (cathepsin A)
MSFSLVAVVWCLLVCVWSQFLPPLDPAKVITSPINSNITIDYREPTVGTCETIFTDQKQYTGYITLPPFTLAPIQQNYSINTFFWFVEARENSSTAPLTIWMNGGPGSSSLIGFFQENGPCEVLQLPDGTYGTVPRVWGWDRMSNMIFIDQPTQTGLSYDVQQNFTRDFWNDTYTPGVDPGSSSILSGQGTFGSQNQRATANTTVSP